MKKSRDKFDPFASEKELFKVCVGRIYQGLTVSKTPEIQFAILSTPRVRKAREYVGMHPREQSRFIVVPLFQKVGSK